MPARKRRTALKSALLAPAGGLLSWGVQQLTAGNTTVGAVAVGVGMALVVAFVALQELDIPYEEEIVEIVAANREVFDEETIRAIAEQVRNEAERRDLNLDGDGRDDG